MINIEQTRQDESFIVAALFEARTRVPMLASRRENRPIPEIVALVELDVQKMQVRFVLARQAIRVRLRELELAGNHHEKFQNTVGMTDNCRLDK